MAEHSELAAEAGMFSGAPQHDTFPLLMEIFPSVPFAAAATPRPFPTGAPLSLPPHYDFGGHRRTVAEFIDSTDTVALLVLQGGEVRHEHYELTGGPDVRWISWSVAKSFVSALVGIAIENGAIGGVDDPISDYVDFMAGSAYEGVRIKDVLQMSSGARWIEDYADPESDISRLATAMGPDGSLDELLAGMQRQREPGTYCQYNSGDTQALGALLAAVTNTTLADYMSEHLVEPLGIETPGYWLRDSRGVEMAFGGLMLTARDFAKLGELYRNGGRVGASQVVPEQWVHDSVHADSDHLQSAAILGEDGEPFGYGYGYQWWLGPGERGDFTAIGVYNQFVYVDPTTDVTIVKLSANRTYGLTAGEESDREAETLEFLRAIADAAAS